MGVQAEPGKAKASGKKAKGKGKVWEAAEGWEAVDVGDSLLLGSTEGGFCGLEELRPAGQPTLGGDAPEPAPSPAPAAAAAGGKRKGGTKRPLQAAPGEQPAPVKGKKARKAAAAAAGDTEQRRQQLEARLAELQAENRQLRATLGDAAPAPEEPANDAAAASPAQSGPAAAPEGRQLNSKQRKKLARDAARAAKRRERVQQEKAAKQSKRQAKAAEAEAAAGAGAAAAAAAEAETTAEAAAEATKAGEPAAPAAPAAGAADMAAWRPFELEPALEGALAALGFSEPTPIQTECLPPAIRDRRDVIGAAQTGSGKTLAFGLPIVQALLGERQREEAPAADGSSDESDGGGGEAAGRSLRALILAPTRELAMQVCTHLQAVARPCGVWVVPIVGGIAPAKQERLLARRPEVVVATPGRLWELMRDGHPHLTSLAGLRFLVLDEADRMVQQGHFEELSRILDLIPRADAQAAPAADEQPAEQPPGAAAAAAGGRLQTFVFSATLTLPESLRRRLRKGGGGASGSVTLEGLMDRIPFQRKPKVVDLTSARRLADKVTESRLECTEEDRDERLYYLLTQHPGRTLVFANAISTVRRLAALLRLLQLPAAPLHASMQQRQRLRALDGFRRSADGILVATDVAARGLDIQDVACVVHYQVPAAVDVYVHRCGRTARAAAEGASIALVTPKESQRFAALLKALDREPPPHFPLDASLLPPARARVRLAARLDALMRSSSKQAAHASWEAQAAEAAGIDLSDGEGEAGAGSAAGDADGRQAEQLRQELAALLQQPLQPGYSRRYFAGAPSASLIARTAAEKAAGEAGSQAAGVQAVSRAVAHARQLAQAQQAAGEARAKQAKRQKKQAKAASAGGVAKPPGKAKGKAKGGKAGSGRARTVVIPGAVARESKGATALQALRRKHGAATG